MIFRANDSSQNALLLLLPVLICVVFCHLYCVSLLRLLAYLFFFFSTWAGDEHYLHSEVLWNQEIKKSLSSLGSICKHFINLGPNPNFRGSCGTVCWVWYPLIRLYRILRSKIIRTKVSFTLLKAKS